MIEGHPDADLRFVHPDGRELRVGPQGLRPEVARRFGAVVPWLPSWMTDDVAEPVSDAGLARAGPLA